YPNPATPPTSTLSLHDALPIYALPVRRIDQADRAMTEVHMRSSRPLFEFHFDMVQRRVRHEQRAAQFQQHGRLDHLDVSPKVADAIASIAEPPAARPWLHRHFQRFTLRIGKTVT